MKTFRRYRLSRFITQYEVAALLQCSREQIRNMEKDKYGVTRATADYYIEQTEEMLNRGPHDFIRPRHFDLAWQPLLKRERERMPRGGSYLTLEYFEPSEWAQATMRHDLRTFAMSNTWRRLIVMRTARATRGSKELLRPGTQAVVIGLKVPELMPVEDFLSKKLAEPADALI